MVKVKDDGTIWCWVKSWWEKHPPDGSICMACGDSIFGTKHVVFTDLNPPEEEENGFLILDKGQTLEDLPLEWVICNQCKMKTDEINKKLKNR